MNPALAIAVGVGAGLVGLLPWLLTGARLPLQNFWLEDTLPEDFPLALLPVSQYYALLIVGLLVAGGVVAGLALRVLARRSPRGWRFHLGIGLVQLMAIVQSFWVTGQGLGVFSTPHAGAVAYYYGMLAGTLVAAALAHLVLHLIGRAQKPGATIGWIVAAVPLTSWAIALVLAGSGPGTVPSIVSQMQVWLPALIAGAALAWCGLSVAGAVRTWVLGILLTLTLPPLAQAIIVPLGTRNILGNVPEMISLAGRTFASSFPSFLLPTFVGLALAGVVSVPRFLMDRREAGGA